MNYDPNVYRNRAEHLVWHAFTAAQQQAYRESAEFRYGCDLLVQFVTLATPLPGNPSAFAEQAWVSRMVDQIERDAQRNEELHRTTEKLLLRGAADEARLAEIIAEMQRPLGGGP